MKLMTRIANDCYPTPVWMTQQLIKFANIQGSIFECCAGKDLAIAKLFQHRPEIEKVWTNDFYFGMDCDYDQDATLMKQLSLFH